MGPECVVFVKFANIFAVFAGYVPLVGSSQQSLVGSTSVSEGPGFSALRQLEQEPLLVAFRDGARLYWRSQQTAKQPVIFFCSLVAVALAIMFLVVKCYKIISTNRGPIMRGRRLRPLEAPKNCTNTPRGLLGGIGLGIFGVLNQLDIGNFWETALQLEQETPVTNEIEPDTVLGLGLVFLLEVKLLVIAVYYFLRRRAERAEGE